MKTKKDYANGEEKLLSEESEMLSSVNPKFKEIMQNQLNLIFFELIRWTKQDPEFEKKVLLDHKSMKRCMKFCSDKAMELHGLSDQEKADAKKNNVPIMTPVGSDMLFEWIKEYYDKDDKAEIEENKKKKAKRTSDINSSQYEKHQERKAVPKGVQNKSENSVTGQISMFDLLGV